MKNKSYVQTLETNNTATNNKMSKFLYDFVLSPWIKKCGAEQRVPPIEKCRIYWTPYSIGFASKSNKKSDWFEARIYHSGVIAISDTTDDYGCEYEISDDGEKYNILATDPYDN